MNDDPDDTHPEMLDRWFARAAVTIVVSLQLSLVENFGFGSRWLGPGLEVVLLVSVTVLSLRAEVIASHAHTAERRQALAGYRQLNHVLGLALVAVISVVNARSLLLLLRALLAGTTHDGRQLLLDAVNIWATNVIVFSLWYWQLDRGGPSIDRSDHRGRPEVIFPQQPAPADSTAGESMPVFMDYFFLSFNTSTAFSPTDATPVSVRMKVLMMLESSMSLLTLALVAARAVNILA